MRKIFIALLITSSLLVISIVSNVVFGVAWREEVAEGKTLRKEIHSLEAKIRASYENNESLKEIGENFAATMFTYNNESAPGVKNKLLELSIGKARVKLLEEPKTGEISETGATKTEYSSEIDIKESSYSRINEKEAVITINFDQILNISGSGSRSEYVMKVYISKAKEWKVNNFEVQQLF